jgi:hypothetical protein
MHFVTQPLFMGYLMISIVVILFFIYKLVPKYGKKTPVIYLTVCSLAGSFTVVACKALGIAIKLTLSGHNQLFYFSTYVFLFSVLSCIILQLNYFNKALDAFNTNIVTPIYYVMFTTLTIVANTILFQGFSGSTSSFISIISGFFTLFIGVFLLNLSKTASEANSAYISPDSRFSLDDISCHELSDAPTFHPRLSSCSASKIPAIDSSSETQNFIEHSYLHSEVLYASPCSTLSETDEH